MDDPDKCSRCGYKPTGDIADWLLVMLVKQPDGLRQPQVVCGECYLKARLNK